MSRAGVNSRAERSLRRAWRWLFVLTLAFVLVVAVLQHRHRSETAAHRALRQSPAFRAAEARFFEEARADELLLHIRDADTGRWRNRRRNELAQSLFPGRTPTTAPGMAANTIAWEDPVRGLSLYFTFGSDGNLSSYSLGPLPATPPQRPWLLGVLRDLDPLRRKWVGSFTAFTIGPMVWGALFVATIAWRRARLPLAYAQLAVAWLCFLGWLLNPNYSVSFKGIFSNDMLFWGTLMLVVSGFSVGCARRRMQGDDPRLCRACGYDLTGNVSGVCPECGTALDGRGAAATASA